MTVCFTGHRRISKDKAVKLSHDVGEIITVLADRGATVFCSGGAMGFDTIAALKVLELKETRPQIKLELILPCRNQTAGWNAYCIQAYNYILERADNVVYTSEKYFDGCMHIRNRELVNRSDICVAYCEHAGSGSAYTVGYAKKKGLEIIQV